MQQEQQRAVRDPGQPRPEAAGVALEGMFVLDLLLDLLPVDAERRIGEHVIEMPAMELVAGQGVAEFDVADLLALDQHVGLADGVALGVEFLAVGPHDRLGVELVDILHPRGQEAARARRRVVDGADDAGGGQGVVILHEHQGGGQADDVARGEVLARRLVGTLGEAPDQLLEHQPHLMVGDGRGREVGGPDLLHHLVQQVGVVELTDELGEIEVLEDLPGILGEPLHIRLQVVLDARFAEGGKIHLREVVKPQVAGGPQQQFLLGLLRQVQRLNPLVFGQHRRLGRRQHPLQPPQQGEGQDHPPVLALLEITTEEIGQGPDVGRQVVG